MDGRLPTYADLVRWDDASLINWQAAAREDLTANPGQPELQRLYEASRVEVANRQKAAWR